MQRREFVLASASVLGATSIGAVAFTQASVERDVTVDIVADDAGPITLNPGDTPAVTLEEGLLTIDTNTANADGLNGDGSFTYGDENDPEITYAFSMVNNAPGNRSTTFGLQNFALTGSSSITMSIYQADGTLAGDVTPSNDVSFDMDEGETVYVVLSFQTDDLNDGDTMNGEFTIDVNA